MSTQIAHCKVLFFCRPGSEGEARIQQQMPDARVDRVETLDEAWDALRSVRYDLIVSERADLFGTEDPALGGRAPAILEALGQGVCVVDTHGGLLWANARLRSYPEEIARQVCEASIRAFHRGQDAEAGLHPYHRARRLSLTAANDQYFDATITPVAGAGGETVQYAAVVWDVTHGRRLQKKIDAIDVAGRELLGLDAAMMAGMDIEARITLLEEKIFRYMREMLNFDNFAVLLIDKKTNRLEIVLEHGMSASSRQLALYASPEGNGISGYVAATGRSYICPDTSKDPRYLLGLETARSSLTIPLKLHEKIIGVFDIESDRPAAFNEDDRQFAEILARYVALALNFFDLLVTERFQSTGQLAQDVSAEIAGPLNDIITEASTLMEEYIGIDDLRARLGAICDRVTEIKQSIKDVASPKTGILGRHGEPAEVDPVLDGRRILVADDEEIIRETVTSVLTKYGCDVETAADGAQAVSLLQTRPYDLVLADIKMPNKNGYEVFAAARESRGSIPVILMTAFGYDPNHSIVRARREGLSAVLFKPFKVDQLLTEVRNGLTASRANASD